MKIEFEIDDKETILLLDVIKRFMGQTGDPNVLKTLSKIVTEIESDLKTGDETFKRVRYRLSPYTNGNKIFPESTMKIYLGINENFITRPGGLEEQASLVLKNLVKKYKPEYDLRKLKKIPLTEIKKCKKIADVVSLIQSKYEKL
ncbi:hypothetical protein [Aquimarina longa]|uniref:hypothetical protein n=1 Tax=Aquimarina longa TaxID=1080221 RepID=UPI0007823075|nr:hypothetical protein [Aquimarina longa]